MRKLIVFNNVSVDGYFVDAADDMSWAHKADPEWNTFVADNAGRGGALLFGRITYQQMASFWPTPAARAMNRAVAEGMNAREKVVFSRTLEQASWANTTLVREGMLAHVRAMKEGSGGDMTVLGSGRVVAQLAEEGLVDEYTVSVNPIALGAGRTMFEGLREMRRLTLKSSRAFANGNVVLSYAAPAREKT